MNNAKIITAAELLYTRKEHQAAQYINRHGLSADDVIAVLVDLVGEYAASFYRKDLKKAQAVAAID